MKKYGWPLLTIIAGAFLLKLVRSYVFVSFSAQLLIALTSFLFFFFGTVCNQHHHSSSADWVKKLFITIVYVFLVILQMGLISLPLVAMAFETIGITSTIYYLLYAYLGYIFF